jgi:hypothetical protein
MNKIIKELSVSVACLLDDIGTVTTKDLHHIQDLVTELENLCPQSDKITTDYYRMAAGFYQFEDLPEDYIKLEDDEFHSLLEANAWQPFEGHRGENIDLHIENLSRAFSEVARNTRKKVLDELKAKLNIK